MHVLPEMFVKSSVTYTEPAAPCDPATFAFKLLVAQEGVPDAPDVLPVLAVDGELVVSEDTPEDAPAPDDAAELAAEVVSDEPAGVVDDELHPATASAARGITPATKVQRIMKHPLS